MDSQNAALSDAPCWVNNDRNALEAILCDGTLNDSANEIALNIQNVRLELTSDP